MESIPFIPFDDSSTLLWPDQFVVLDDGYLWIDGSELIRLVPVDHGVRAHRLSGELNRGMDRLIAADRNVEGLITLLDTAGRIATYDPTFGTTSRLAVHPSAPVGDLANSGDTLYLLLEGFEGGPAVEIHDLSQAREPLRIGSRPASSAVQATLGGGGIASCPDGTAYYTTINDPGIHRIEREAGGIVALRDEGLNFSTFSSWSLRRARNEVDKTQSVKPLVELALGASRVTHLSCSAEGLLFRQVVRPSKKGSYVELWNPRIGRIVATHEAGYSLLLSVRNGTLYLGRSDAGHFVLDRIRYQLEQEDAGA